MSNQHIGQRVGFPGSSVAKNPPANAGKRVQSLGGEDFPWTEEPDGLQGLQRSQTQLSDYTITTKMSHAHNKLVSCCH